MEPAAPSSRMYDILFVKNENRTLSQKVIFYGFHTVAAIALAIGYVLLLTYVGEKLKHIKPEEMDAFDNAVGAASVYLTLGIIGWYITFVRRTLVNPSTGKLKRLVTSFRLWTWAVWILILLVVSFFTLGSSISAFNNQVVNDRISNVLTNGTSATSSAQEIAIQAMFNTLVENNKQLLKDEQSVGPDAITVDSFSSQQKISAQLSTLNRLNTELVDYKKSWKSNIAKVIQTVQNGTGTPAFKRGVIDGFNQSMNDPQQLATIENKTQLTIDLTLKVRDLYTFANQHFSEYSITGTGDNQKMVFEDQATLDSFNKLMDAIDSIRTQLRQADEQIVQSKGFDSNTVDDVRGYLDKKAAQ